MRITSGFSSRILLGNDGDILLQTASTGGAAVTLP
jgi:hypothetical protein